MPMGPKCQCQSGKYEGDAVGEKAEMGQAMGQKWILPHYHGDIRNEFW